MDTISMRRTLDRLKRGVPPTMGIDDLSVGMSGLQAKLDALLSPNASPRWFPVQSEYGEGKSHFHSYARYHALRSGYAVASLDVNGQDGALHQPQRHLAIVLSSLQSPLPQFSNYQGFGDIIRHWLESADESEVTRILHKLRSVEPCLAAGRDPFDLWNWSAYFIHSRFRESMRSYYYPHLLRFFTTEDLTNKSSYARFASSFRLQIIIRWLMESGHKGLFLFIDEVDNIVRQIHRSGHAGCFRTLAWYCSCPAYPELRVVLASTPEVAPLFEPWHRAGYLNTLRYQRTVREKEVSAFEQWDREISGLLGEGWQHCPHLTKILRKVLFKRIARLHQAAWSWSWEDSNGTVDELAAGREFQTTRRWVRACVQLLDTLQQADGKFRGSLHSKSHPQH